MWKPFLKSFLPFWVLYGVIGWWFGSKLIAIPNLQGFKVLNILGLAADFAGIIILSRFVSQNARYQKLVAGPIAEQIYSFLFVSVTTVFVRCHAGQSGVSSTQLQAISGNLFMFMLVPVSGFLPAFTEKVIPTLKWTEERKTSALGGALLVFGVLVQIWAAVLDLYS